MKQETTIRSAAGRRVIRSGDIPWWIGEVRRPSDKTRSEKLRRAAREN